MEYVVIQSTKTIWVTPGLQYEDVTDYDSHAPNRLRVNSQWQHCSYLLKAGINDCPPSILEWKSIKKLQELRVITVDSKRVDITETPEQRKKRVAIERIAIEKTA